MRARARVGRGSDGASAGEITRRCEGAGGARVPQIMVFKERAANHNPLITRRPVGREAVNFATRPREGHGLYGYYGLAKHNFGFSYFLHESFSQ